MADVAEAGTTRQQRNYAESNTGVSRTVVATGLQKRILFNVFLHKAAERALFHQLAYFLVCMCGSKLDQRASLTQPPLFFSQVTKLLRTNSPRQSTMV